MAEQDKALNQPHPICQDQTKNPTAEAVEFVFNELKNLVVFTGFGQTKPQEEQAETSCNQTNTCHITSRRQGSLV